MAKKLFGAMGKKKRKKGAKVSPEDMATHGKGGKPNPFAAFMKKKKKY